MTKTTGQQIIETWRTETPAFWDEGTEHWTDLSQRIDQALETANAQVTRLREALLGAWDHNPDCLYRWSEGDCNCCEALAKKETP